MAEGLWRTTERDGWRFRLLLADTGLKQLTDVEVRAPDGRCWVGTVGTLKAVEKIMSRYAETGECLGGVYFWASGLLILRDEDEGAAFDSLEGLVDAGELESCFEEVESEG